jgi:hypothetical protein
MSESDSFALFRAIGQGYRSISSKKRPRQAERKYLMLAWSVDKWTRGQLPGSARGHVSGAAAWNLEASDGK